MRSRLLTLLLIILLALPVTAVLPPVQASIQLQEPPAPMLAAKKNDNKKKNKKDKPKFKTVRQSVTQTFTNPARIDVPNGTDLIEVASPYPSAITVGGFANGVITDVDVILHGFTWNDEAVPGGHPQDAEILVAATQLPGISAIVLSEVGGDESVTNLTLRLDDEAAMPPPTPLVSGTFQPTNFDSGVGDSFPAPGPGYSDLGNSLLSVFDGGNPNGIWQLFVVDDFGDQDPGSINAGWSLTVTAEVDKKVKKKTKKKGKGRR